MGRGGLGLSAPVAGGATLRPRIPLLVALAIITPNIGASVFAVQRHGSHLRDKIERMRLLAGDVLLLQGSDEALRKLRTSTNALVVEGVDRALCLAEADGD